ncbi:hypothetical protein GALMADRAFT_1052126 [Galerina marginata CBS 339.88]|uniref:Uncharacterized protein n=1 Tax=Galerina marginata (strain CBS 339.88) TaxID=685588 RepID=A0A067SMY8_GALM3|nr:hypothetical protein GALMADRAFT_1052126 [Galerina marginata CBS 339.88]
MTTNLEPGLSIGQLLPFDILEEIFFHSLLDENSQDEHFQPNSSISPILLLHVCKSWKSAALNMPYLWSSIYLTIPYFRLGKSPCKILDTVPTAELTKWWNTEHISIPPSLYFKPRVPPTPQHRRVIESQIKTSQIRLRRFLPDTFFRSALRLELHLNPADFKMISSVHTMFDNLVDLRIQSTLDSGGTLSIDFPFPPSPKLRRLHLSAYHSEGFLHQVPGSLLFPWGQLTHLYLPQSIPQHDWVDLIKTCLNLQLGAFNISFRDDSNTTTTDSQISVVNLQDMVFGTHQFEPSPLKELLFPRLTALRLVSMDINIFTSLANIAALLQATPALTELHLDFCLNFWKPESSFFTDENAELEDNRLSMVVPQLRLLVIDFIDPGDAIVGPNIIQFLQSRWLCSGWTTLDAEKTRRLELLIAPESTWFSWTCFDDIMREVGRYLEKLQEHPAFLISARKGGRSRERFEVFNEGTLRRGWDEAFQFQGV